MSISWSFVYERNADGCVHVFLPDPKLHRFDARIENKFAYTGVMDGDVVVFEHATEVFFLGAERPDRHVETSHTSIFFSLNMRISISSNVAVPSAFSSLSSCFKPSFMAS